MSLVNLEVMILLLIQNFIHGKGPVPDHQINYTASFFYSHFFYGHFFYGLKDLDRKKRNLRKNDRKRRIRLRDYESSDNSCTTFFYGHFFYGPTFSLHTRP